MATALAATARIVTNYEVSGILHTHHAYIRGLTLVGGVWMHNSRALDNNDQVWTDSAQAIASTIGAVMVSAVVFGTSILQKLISGVWQPEDVSTPTVSPSGGALAPASQITVTLRDKLFHKVKITVMEANQLPPQHWIDPLGGAANLDTFIAQFLPTFTVSNAPYGWLVGRGNQYLADNPFVAATLTYNKKMRRRRGLT